MNDSQIPLQAGQDVKHHLSREDVSEEVDADSLHENAVGVDAQTAEGESQDVHQLQDDYVVGEGVRVAQRDSFGRPPPSLQSHAQNGQAEREEEEVVEDGEDGDAYSTDPGAPAEMQPIKHGEEREMRRGVGEGGRVCRHACRNGCGNIDGKPKNGGKLLDLVNQGRLVTSRAIQCLLSLSALYFYVSVLIQTYLNEK